MIDPSAVIAGDGVTDRSAELQALADAMGARGGGRIWLPFTGQPVALNRMVTMREGVWIEGETPDCTLMALPTHLHGKLLKWDAVRRGGLRSLTIDGNAGVARRNIAMSVSRSEGVRFLGVTARRVVCGLRIDSDSRRIIVDSPDIEDAETNGIEVVDSHWCEIRFPWTSGSGAFGVIFSGTSSRGLVAFPACARSGRELVGWTAGTKCIRVIGHHAEATGDNGLSASGDMSVVVGGISYHNALTGVHGYGEHNAVVGVVAVGNGQARNPVARAAGVRIAGRFGGEGAGSVVAGCVAWDDQEDPTQLWGIDVKEAEGRGNVAAANVDDRCWPGADA